MDATDLKTGRLTIVLTRILLTFLIAAGIIFRMIGLGWGIPLAVPPETTGLRNSYHLDEDKYLRGAAKVSLRERNLDVGDYHWGTLQFYLVAGALKVAALSGFLKRPWRESFLEWRPDEFQRIYVVGRIVSAITGILSIFLIYKIGRKLMDSTAGLMAAAFLAVTPLHVVDSHFLTADVTMVCLLLSCTFFLLSSLDEDTFLNRAAGGLSLGLAISAKYNAVCLLPLWVCLDIFRMRANWKRRIVGYAALLAGFAIGEPYALIHPSAITDSWARIFPSDASSPFLIPWPSLLLQQAWAFARYGIGWTLALPAAIGAVWWIVRPTPKRAAIAALTILAVIFVVAARWPMLRYTLPIVPLGALAAASFVTEFLARATVRMTVIAIMAALPLAISLAQVGLLVREHPANTASRWISENVRPGSRIGQLWPEVPPLNSARFDLRRMHGLFAGESPAAADLDRQFLILDNLPIQPFSDDFQERLARDYHLLKEFRSDPRIGRWVIDEPRAPHDWKYTHPIVRIYGRRGVSLGQSVAPPLISFRIPSSNFYRWRTP